VEHHATVYVDNDCHDWCAKMFTDMVEARSVHDETTFMVMLTAVVDLRNLALGKWVHG
jgi:hypothetical protein